MCWYRQRRGRAAGRPSRAYRQPHIACRRLHPEKSERIPHELTHQQYVGRQAGRHHAHNTYIQSEGRDLVS